jgi:hypothetical protein
MEHLNQAKMKLLLLLFLTILNVFVLRAQPVIEWSKTYGGNYADSPNQILPLDDGGYLIVGRTESADGNVSFNHGGRDVWVTKIGPAGQLEWEKTYGGSGTESALGVNKTADGGFLIAGYSNSNDQDVSGRHGTKYDGWIFKINSAGNIVWQRMLGGTEDEFINEMEFTPDGGIVVVG